MKTNWKILATVLICLMAAGNLMAQSARGGIQGSVADTAGEPLPGVTVVINSESMQGTRSTVTDTNGTFRFPLVPPGTYTAVLALTGYQRFEQQNIRVGLEQTITLDVSLNSTFTEEVMVTAESPVIDTTSPAIGSDFNQTLLNDMPLSREFNEVVFLATGAVEGGGIANDAIGGNASIMGASALENRYVVDQLDTTDVAEGRAGTQISTSFISEMQVKVGGYQAEYGGALGGVVNMITKSGGNEFHGDVFGYFSNDSMWADAKIPETRGDARTVDSEWDVGFTIGGKIVTDKLWFFLGYNPNTLDQNIVNDVYGVDESILQTNDFIRTYEKGFYSGKLTWQLNQNNSITGTVLGDPTTITNQFSTSNFVDSPLAVTDQFYDSDEGGLNYGFNWNSVLGQSLMLEVTYGRHQSKQEFVPNTDVTAYQDQTTDGIWSGGASDVFFGGPQFQQPRDDRQRQQARVAFSWFLGQNHELKFGGGWNDVKYDMLYGVPGPSDAFCTPTLEGGPYEYDFETGTYPQIGTNCSVNNDGVLDGYAMPARIGNRYRLRNGYYYNRNYKNDSTGETEEFSVYAQDSWQVASNFTISLGVRAESSTSQGDLTKILPERKLEFSFGDMVAPRIGFVWDPSNEGRSKIFAHYGKFYQSIPLTINVRSFGNENYDFYFYEDPVNGMLPDTNNPGVLTYIYRSSSELTFLDPAVEPQYLEEFVLGGEYEVATDLALGLKFVRRELGEVIEDISVDNGSSYFITNPGGIYTENPTNGIPLDPPVDFPAAVRDYDGVEFSVSKRFSNRWQGYASILWSDLVGNYEGLYSRDNQQIDPNITSKFDLPELLNNAYGTLQNNREWQFKMFGSYRFDFGLVTGLNMFYVTGNPISKLGADRSYGLDERFVTPRGSEGTTDSWLNFDLSFSYPIQLGNFQLDLMLDIFNIFDEQVAVEVDQRWTTLDPSDYPGGEAPPDEGADMWQENPTWGEPLNFSPPRNFRVGIRFAW
jgi:hypothetical protein